MKRVFFLIMMAAMCGSLWAQQSPTSALTSNPVAQKPDTPKTATPKETAPKTTSAAKTSAKTPAKEEKTTTQKAKTEKPQNEGGVSFTVYANVALYDTFLEMKDYYWNESGGLGFTVRFPYFSTLLEIDKMFRGLDAVFMVGLGSEFKIKVGTLLPYIGYLHEKFGEPENMYGIAAGLLYEIPINERFFIGPSLRLNVRFRDDKTDFSYRVGMFVGTLL